MVTVCLHVLGLQNWEAKSLISDAAHSRHQPSCKSMGPAPPLDHVSPGGVLQTGTLSFAAHQGWCWIFCECFSTSPSRTTEDIVSFLEKGAFHSCFISACIMLEFYLNSNCQGIVKCIAFCLRHFCLEEKVFHCGVLLSKYHLKRAFSLFLLTSY